MTMDVKIIRELQEMIALGQPLVNLAFQNMDLTSLTDTLINSGIRESLFLGCLLENRAACRLQRENYIFPIMDLPYPIYPNRRSEEHTSELQSRGQLVCRLLLET